MRVGGKWLVRRSTARDPVINGSLKPPHPRRQTRPINTIAIGVNYVLSSSTYGARYKGTYYRRLGVSQESDTTRIGVFDRPWPRPQAWKIEHRNPKPKLNQLHRPGMVGGCTNRVDALSTLGRSVGITRNLALL